MVRYRWYCTVDGTLVAVQDRAAAWKTESCYASFRSNLFGIVTQKTHAVPSSVVTSISSRLPFTRVFGFSLARWRVLRYLCVRETERVHAVASRLSLR